MVRDKIFISYSHKDKKWLERLQTMLKPLVRSGQITVWDDKEIKVGAQWHEEIMAALATAKVGLIMVSPNFLASDFISEVELPSLLKAAKNEGLEVCWILLSTCLYETSELSRFQAAHDISRPLDSLSPSQLNTTLANIARQIQSLALKDRKEQTDDGNALPTESRSRQDIRSNANQEYEHSALINVPVLINPPPSPNRKEVFDEFHEIQFHLESLGVQTEEIDEPKNSSIFPLIEYSSNAAAAASELQKHILPIIQKYRKHEPYRSIEVNIRKRNASHGKKAKLWLHL